MMTLKDWFNIVVKPKIALIKEEVESVAKLVKEFNMKNEQEIIDYEDFLNTYSTIDYDTL